MAPSVTFVRHAQGYHNLGVSEYSRRDPRLTTLGRQQCAALSECFPAELCPDLIVASPLKRTISTALLSFPKQIAGRNLTIIAVPELQETSGLPCDRGSPRAELKEEYAGEPLDLSLVVDGWESKEGRWAPVWAAVEERARLVRHWLRQRPEKHIVVVTHGAMAHHITQDWTNSTKFDGTGWANTEYRTYTFKSERGRDASLVETEESCLRRKSTKSSSPEASRRDPRASSRSTSSSRNNHFGRSSNSHSRSRDRPDSRESNLRIQAKV